LLLLKYFYTSLQHVETRTDVQFQEKLQMRADCWVLSTGGFRWASIIQ